MRQQVYDKYHGHCAYCGKEIKMSEMQVDHIIPLAHSVYGPREQAEKVMKMFEDDSINAIDNLMPACRACNFYKGINNIDGLREGDCAIRRRRKRDAALLDDEQRPCDEVAKY